MESSFDLDDSRDFASFADRNSSRVVRRSMDQEEFDSFGPLMRVWVEGFSSIGQELSRMDARQQVAGWSNHVRQG